MNVSILGTGYVGLTTGACLAYLGHNVTCVDIDPGKITKLAAGEAPFYEPHLEDMLVAARHNLRFTTSYEEAIPDSQVVFIAVGTPSGANGAPNMDYLRSAAQQVGANLGDGFTVIVNKSTVPIGSAHWVESLVRDAAAPKGRGADCFAVASNPEFLREGSALGDSLYPDRVVIGAEEPKTAAVLYTLYRPILDQVFQAPPFLPRPERLGAIPLISTDLASAELIKYAANAFLSTKISYINEIALLAGKVGAKIGDVARGIGLDARIGNQFLKAGIGWGGSCFGKDTMALVKTAEEYKLDMPIVKAAREVNARQRERAVEILLEELKILKGRNIGLLGLAFKPETDDLREAPAVDVAQRLIERGARVQAHDPVAMDRFRSEHGGLGVTLCAQAADVAQDADALILVTEWSQYSELDWDELAGRMRKPVLLDGRGVLNPDRMKRAGFRYLTIAG